MKALSFKVPKTKNESLRVQVDYQPYFYDSFHYHPEFQVSYILDGSGTRIIGNSVGRFNKNEIYFIGSNIPHIFKSDSKYYKKDSKYSHAISLYFTEEALGKGFFDLPEARNLSNLLKDAKKLILFNNENIKTLKKDFIKISKASGFDKIKLFLDILYKISEQKQRKLLSKTAYEQRDIAKFGKRINDVFDFVVNNYSNQITLKKAANIANLSTTAFCRFFKERTRKSFTEFVNEVRIGEACKLLSGNYLNISQICYEVGFNNISNFNRKFKQFTGLTPKEYRKTVVGNSEG